MSQEVDGLPQCKVIGDSFPEECFIKVIHTGGVMQQLCLWVHPCVYPHILYPFFLLISKHFTCFITFCLCGNSFLQSQRARTLVTDHRSRGWNLVVSPTWLSLNLYLGTQALLQATVGQGDPRSERQLWGTGTKGMDNRFRWPGLSNSCHWLCAWEQITCIFRALVSFSVKWA